MKTLCISQFKRVARGVLAVALGGAFMTAAAAQNDTFTVRQDVRNYLFATELFDGQLPAVAFLNGHVGAYPHPEDGEAPRDGVHQLVQSSMGQPTARYIAYPGLADETIRDIEADLFPRAPAGGLGELISWSLEFTAERRSPLVKSDETPHITASETRLDVDDAGGAFAVTLQFDGADAPRGEIWYEADVTQGDSWIDIEGESEGSLGGLFANDTEKPLEFSVDANPGGTPRAGYVRVRSYFRGTSSGGEPSNNSPILITVIQGAAEATLDIGVGPERSRVVNIPPGGGSATVDVDLEGSSDTNWQADFAPGDGGETFITLEDASGSETGAFTVDVAPNTSNQPRNSLILVVAPSAVGGPQPLYVNQQATASYEETASKSISAPGQTKSGITISDDFTVKQARVELEIAHDWFEDIEVRLRAPSGAETVLFSQVGGGATGIQARFDDAAGDTLDGLPPVGLIAGEFQPQGALGLFRGENAGGEWQLIVEDFDTRGAAVQEAAFRFIDLLYGLDDGQPVNQLEARMLTAGQLLDQHFGQAERDRIDNALAQLREALRHQPHDRRLWRLFLDVAYHRTVANAIVAREQVVDSHRVRTLPPQLGPDESIIDYEIDQFKTAYNELTSAIVPYLELLQDRMGVKSTEVDRSADPNMPFGYYLFQNEVPDRRLFPATYLDGGERRAVTGQETNVEPVLDGYKDLALLLDLLADTADAARHLAELYLMRGETGDGSEPNDVERAAALVDEVFEQLTLEAAMIEGVFPELEDELNNNPASFGGLAESRRKLREALTGLEHVRGVIDGSENLLGFTDDFLMLIQRFDESTANTFDAIMAWNDPGDTASPLGRALHLAEEAADRYDDYRGGQDQLANQFMLLTNTYRDRLAAITGVDPGPDPSNPVDPAYNHPEENEGSEIHQQLLSIDIAMSQIQENEQEIANIEEQMENEVERRALEAEINAAIGDLFIQYGDKQAGLTSEIANIRARQAEADNAVEAASAFVVGTDFTFNPGQMAGAAVNSVLQREYEERKGALEASKERLAAMEQAEIRALEDQLLDVESQIRIKDWLMDMKILQIQSQQAALTLQQEISILAGLYGELADTEARMAEISENLVQRYYADPVHRLRFQAAMLRAKHAFDEAQRWMFFTLRALEYRFNNRGFVTPAGTSMQSVFRARTAGELMDIYADVNQFAFAQDDSDERETWLSVRDLKNWSVSDLRRELLRSMDEEGVLRLTFSTVHDDERWFYRGPSFDGQGRLITEGTYLDRIESMKINIVGDHSVENPDVGGAIKQAGEQYVRTQSKGEPIPDSPDRVTGEYESWSTRYWYQDVLDGSWRFTDGLVANAVFNLTPNRRDMNTGNTFRRFSERSVAATDWRVRIFTRDSQGRAILNVNEIDDIEIYIVHHSLDRPSEVEWKTEAAAN